ncbi:MAG: nicotinate (nicotinamide) nucleotide adenylyltransferase [Chitinivibrionales bacterium]|nr:nicotinate (nicotinamide) nucleotide adenylyltransferase [Chitinivibrionales bacterium]
MASSQKNKKATLLQAQLKHKIGLLGSAFDPIHYGHLAIAQMAYEHFKLEKVYFIPSGNPPHKSGLIGSIHHRVAMVREALRGKRQFKLWNGEIRRSGINYTIDTLNDFRRRFPDYELYFIIGSDNITELLTWKNYRQIIRLVTLCVAHRPGYSFKIPEQLSSATFVTCPSPEWGLSSTLVRNYLHHRLSCAFLLPRGVAAYIQRHTLYV